MKKVVAIVAVCLGASIALAGVPAQQMLDQQGLKAMPGDVTLDQRVDYMDLMAILDWDSGLVDLSDVQLRRADVNVDGLVNIDDAAIVAARIAMDGKVRVGYEVTVDPRVGVVDSRVINPFATLAERMNGVKAHELNPPELSQANAVCTNCDGCLDLDKDIVTDLLWTSPGAARDANYAQCLNDLAFGPPNGQGPGACIFENQGASSNVDLSDPAYTESVAQIGNGDSFIQDGETLRIFNTVPVVACQNFTFRLDVDLDVSDGNNEE